MGGGVANRSTEREEREKVKSYKRLLHETSKLKEGGAAWERNITQLKTMLNNNPKITETLRALTK